MSTYIGNILNNEREYLIRTRKELLEKAKTAIEQLQKIECEDAEKLTIILPEDFATEETYVYLRYNKDEKVWKVLRDSEKEQCLGMPSISLDDIVIKVCTSGAFVSIKEIAQTTSWAEMFMEKRKEEKRLFEDNIIYYQRDITNAQQKIKQNLEKILESKTRLEELEINPKAIQEEIKRIEQEISSISKMKQVKGVARIGNSLYIRTKMLYLTEPYTEKRYELDEYTIEIKNAFSPSNTIICIDAKNRRHGYNEHMPHPHVFEDGNACWGNVDYQIATYTAKGEYAALVATIIAFLQTCDIDDCAGWYASVWDEVNLKNEIICKGHTPTHDEYGGEGYGQNTGEYECEVCGATIWEDEVYTCDDCGRTICCDCTRDLRRSDGMSVICSDCAEANYNYCNECGEYYEAYEGVELADGTIICPNCADNCTVTCAHCEQRVWEGDAHYIMDEWICDRCEQEMERERTEERTEESNDPF